MKKIIIVVLLGLFLFITISTSGLITAREEITENLLFETVTDQEEAVFDKLYQKDTAEVDDLLYIDFMNEEDKPSLILDNGVKVEYEFLSQRLLMMNSTEKKSIRDYSLNRSAIEKNQISDLLDFVDTSLKLEEINNRITELDWLSENIELVQLLLPSEENGAELKKDYRRIIPQTSYQYYPVGYSSIDSFDDQNIYKSQVIQYKQYYNVPVSTEKMPYFATIEDINFPYSITIEPTWGYDIIDETNIYVSSTPYDFYLIEGRHYYRWVDGWFGINSWNGHHDVYDLFKKVTTYEKIFTGNYYYVLSGNIESHPHAEKIGPFNYKNWDVNIMETPEVKIALILDYFGKEKLILSTFDSQLQSDVTFYITQEIHWGRNKYNRNSSNTPYFDLYSHHGDILGKGWTYLTAIQSYFHLLLPKNFFNVKYIKSTSYFDSTLNQETTGEFEIVYSDPTIFGTVVTDPLVVGTFNFGVKANSNSSSNNAVISSHYLRDVLPYLFWGNNEEDFNNYSVFERFLWDKDSSNILHLHRNYSGQSLMNSYYNGIGDAGGSPIPTFIRNVRSPGTVIQDVHAPIFNVITSQTITTAVSSKDWSLLISGISDNMNGSISKYEISDGVNYTVVGTYVVIVGVRDESGNEFRRSFNVIISSNSGGGTPNPPFIRLPS